VNGRLFISMALVLLAVLLTGCVTTSTPTTYIPEGANIWPPKTVLKTDDLTIEKTYAYRKETQVWDGKKLPACTPMVTLTITMPSGSRSYTQDLINLAVHPDWLGKNPDWWNENVSVTNDVFKWAPGQFLVPGLGIVQGYKTYPWMNGHWSDSDVFYGKIFLEIGHFEGEIDSKERRDYFGIIIPDPTNPFIAASAVLIPWGYRYFISSSDYSRGKRPKHYSSEAIIYDDKGVRRLDLFPIYEKEGIDKGFHQFVDDQIHFISYGGNNPANCKSHWLNKSGELDTSENIFFRGSQPDKFFYQITDSGGVISVDWDTDKKPLTAFTSLPMKKIEIKEQAVPIRDNTGFLKGFMVSDVDPATQKKLYGWRDVDFKNWTGFIWDDYDASPTNGVILVHIPEKGWAAAQSFRINNPFVFEGIGHGEQGKIAALNHAHAILAEENRLHQEEMARRDEQWKKDREAKWKKEHEEYLVKKAAEEQRQAEINAQGSGAAPGSSSGYSQSWSEYKDEANVKRKEAQQQQRERDLKNGIFRDSSFYD